MVRTACNEEFFIKSDFVSLCTLFFIELGVPYLKPIETPLYELVNKVELSVRMSKKDNTACIVYKLY